MRFKHLSKREKKILCIQTQAKLRSYRIKPKYKFGYQITRSNDYEHALSIDKHNVNNKWAESIKLETHEQHDYETYKNMGKGSSPEGHKLIRVHFVLYVKCDGRHEPQGH